MGSNPTLTDMSSPIEEIKSRLDIVEFINSYVRLEKAGINYKARCPFHTEKTPSFFVSPARQIWHCFGGCGEGGDIFRFVMKIEGYDFPEALRLLAQRAGVVLKREDPRIRSERNRLYDICEEAAAIFEKTFQITPAVKAYIKKRGVADSTIREFRIGFAPQSWDFLLKALIQKGFKPEEIEKAGLVIKSEDDNSWYDRFRSRIMFPIMDANGRVVGFSGRIFHPDSLHNPHKSFSRNVTEEVKKEEAKYVNTPQTLIYDKSRVLYGFDKAKQEIRAKNKVVVVEGQMDLIMSHQAGVKNAIAVSGTALTPQQLKTLRRLCDTIVSSFDTDSAGDSATRRSLELAAEFEFNCRIAVIPSGKDPADTVLENPEAWKNAVETAKPVVEFYFEKAFREKNSSTAEGKKEISALLIPFIRELSSEIEKAHWVSELARRLAISEEAVWKELRKSHSTALYPREVKVEESADSVVVKGRPRRELLEERVLALMAVIGEDIQRRELENHHLVFTASEHGELFNLFSAGARALSGAAAIQNFPPHLQEKAETFRFKGEVLLQMTDDVEKEFIAAKRELEKECIREKLLALGEEIKRIEQTGNKAELHAILIDFRTLSEKLRDIS